MIDDIVNKYLGEMTSATDWKGPHVPMTRKEALSRIEKTDDKEEMGFLIRVANLAGATQHEMRNALDGRTYTMFKGDINDPKYKKWTK